jgi:hypothetical protein
MNNERAQIRIELIEGDKKITTSMYLDNYLKTKELHGIPLGDDMIGSLIEEFNKQKNK